MCCCNADDAGAGRWAACWQADTCYDEQGLVDIAVGRRLLLCIQTRWGGQRFCLCLLESPVTVGFSGSWLCSWQCLWSLSSMHCRLWPLACCVAGAQIGRMPTASGLTGVRAEVLQLVVAEVMASCAECRVC